MLGQPHPASAACASGGSQPQAASPASPATGGQPKAKPDTPGETAKPVSKIGSKPEDDKASPTALAIDRTGKALMRYNIKARVLSGQDRNPWDTVNLFPTNPDMPKVGRGTSFATRFMQRGQDAKTARDAGLPLLSLGQATKKASELAAELPGQRDTWKQAVAAVKDKQGRTAVAAGTAGRAANGLARAEAGLAQVHARSADAAARVEAAQQRQAAATGVVDKARAGLDVGKAKAEQAATQALHGPRQTAAEWQVNQKVGIANRAEQVVDQQHAGFVASTEQRAGAVVGAAQTRKQLGNAQRIVASGHGSAETFEGFWSNGKDGLQSGAGLTAGTVLGANVKAWSQGKMTASKAATDLVARTTLSGGAGLLATGVGTELSAALATGWKALAVNTEKGAALGGKFGGRWGALAGGVLTGTGSVLTAIGVGRLTDHKDGDGKSWLDRNVTDPVSDALDRSETVKAARAGLRPVTEPLKHIAKAVTDNTD